MMSDAKTILEQYYLEMRWRALSLAADLDRIERAAGGPALLQTDPRLIKIKQGLQLILESSGNRAERFQDLFSDHTPPPR
jgi:hypothetical protein